MIAQDRADFQKYYNDMTLCLQDWLVYRGKATVLPSDNPGLYICGFETGTVAADAADIVVEFHNLGTPPPEISDLVDQTRTALRPIGQISNLQGCNTSFGGNPLSDGCARATGTIDDAMTQAERVLAAWQPYTG